MTLMKELICDIWKKFFRVKVWEVVFRRQLHAGIFDGPTSSYMYLLNLWRVEIFYFYLNGTASIIAGEQIWNTVKTEEVKKVFADYLKALACPRKEIVIKRIENNEQLSDIQYRRVVFKINNILQTLKRRRGIKK